MIVNVVKPTGSITVDHFGVAGLTPPAANGDQSLKFDWRGPDPSPGIAAQIDDPNPGIRWDAHVNVPTDKDGNSLGGNFFVTQTLKGGGDKIVREWKDASGNLVIEQQNVYSDGYSPNFFLDTVVHYPERVSDQKGGSGTDDVYDAVVGKWLRSADTPGQSFIASFRDKNGLLIQNPVSLRRTDYFYTTVMYEPTSTTIPSIAVPVRRIEWDWTVLAERQNGTWVQTFADQHFTPNIDASSNAGFPTWWDNVAKGYFARWVQNP